METTVQLENLVTAEPLLRITDLAVSFSVGAGGDGGGNGGAGGNGGTGVRAVEGLSLTVHPKQTLALVGESGCGKSVTALSILGLIPCPPGRMDRGAIEFRKEGRGHDLMSISEKELLTVRGREIAMIFQEPTTSLNPVYSVGDQLMETILLHREVTRGEARGKAEEALSEVGLGRVKERMRMYPHEFSGGMLQRVMIAMALACRPQLLLADEPTTALDVTIQRQILDLLRDIQDSRDMGILFITHDLGVVAEVADVVCVMYGGRVVEYAQVYRLFDKAYHPYTRGLLSSIPKLRERRRRLNTVAEALTNEEAFRSLPGVEFGIIPWWPSMTPPKDLAQDGGGEYYLYEIEPEHWVGCWRTEYLAEHPGRVPDVEYRR